MERITCGLDEGQQCLAAIEDLTDDWKQDHRENVRKSLEALGERERVIRHQLNRLENASDAAVEDLWNGLEIAWERFSRELRVLRERVVRHCASHAISTKPK